MRLRMGFLLCAALAVGCADESGSTASMVDGGAAFEAFDFLAPRLETLAPTEIALGDDLDVFGAQFLPPDQGNLRLVLDGVFTTDDKREQPFRGELPLTYVNASRAKVAFEQNLFSPAAGRVGTFVGKAHLVSRVVVSASNAPAGSELASDPKDVTVTVLPSVDVTGLRTVDERGCAPVTAATNAGSNLTVELRAVGLGEATPEEPITFRVGFQSSTLAVMYVKRDVYQSWPLDLQPGQNDNVHVGAPKGDNTITFEITSGDSLVIDPTRRQSVVRVNPPVNVGAQVHSEVLLGRFAAGPVEGGPGANRANLMIEARRGDRSATRVVHIDVWNQWEILPYDGNQRLVERYAAEVPSGQCGSCIAGGDIGREVGYTEGESTSRSRSISMRWDVSVANSLGVNVMVGPFIPWQIAANAQTTWSSTFGMDVTESVSTETHRSVNVNAHVLPSFFALCYRQLSRYERTVKVAYHNGCGATAVVGEAIVTDWGWGFDVATGQQCPPGSNLPSGHKYE